MKTIKKTNLFFLILMILYVAAIIILFMFSQRGLTMHPAISIIFNEVLFIVPAFIFLLLGQYNISLWIPFRKVKWSTLGLTILFTICAIPFVSFVNILSQLISTNKVAEIAGSLFSMPFLPAWFIVGVFGPFCEEFVFRGVIFSGLKSTGSIFMATLASSLFFGLMHMNLNQLIYAFFLGIALALLLEATGSIIPSLILHMLFNSFSVVLEYGLKYVYSYMGIDFAEITNDIATGIDKVQLIMLSGVYLIPAAVGVFLCVMIYIAICKNEGTFEHIKEVFKQQKSNVITVSGIIGITICLIVIFFLDKIETLIIG